MAPALHRRLAAPVMRRGLRYLLVTVLLAVGSAAALLAWLLYSEPGARFLWARASSALPGLSAGAVRGSLRGGIDIEEFELVAGGTVVRASRLGFALDPDLLPPALALTGVAVQDLRVRLAPGDDDGPPPTVDAVFGALDLPLPVAVRDLEIVRAVVERPDGSALLTLAEASLAAELDGELRVGRLAVAGSAGTLELDGRLGLGAPHPVAARVAVTFAEAPAAGWLPAAADVELDGTLDVLRIALAGRAPALTASGTLTDALSAPQFDLAIRAPSLPQAGNDEPPLALADVDLAVSGTANAYRATGRAGVVTGFAAPFDAAVRLSGNLDGLAVERLDLDSAELAATASGRLGWTGGLSAAADLDIERVDPARWIGDWPDGETVQGRAALEFAGANLEVTTFALDQRASAIAGRARIDLDAGVVDAKLDWRDLQWPPAPAEPRIASSQATLTVGGRPEAWRLDGDVALATPDLPAGRFTLAGEGSTERVALEIRDSEVLGGRVTGDLEFERADGGRFRATLDTRRLAITPFLPDWPGRLSARVAASGRLEPRTLDLAIDDLTGDVRARPVAAAGRLRLDGEQLEFDDFRLRSGESRIALDGSWSQPSGLGFDIEVETLADFLPDAAGRIAATGRFEAGRPWPRLDIELTASDLGWRGWSVEALELANRPAGDAPLGFDLEARGLGFGERQATTATLAWHGDPAAHDLALSLATAGGEARARLAGGFAEPSAPFVAGWNGELAEFAVVVTDSAALDLRHAATLRASTAGIALGQGCVDAAGGGSLCLAGDWTAGGHRAIRVELDTLPLDLLRAVSGEGFVFTQALTGTVALESGPAGRLSGSGRLDLTPGEIRNPYDERLTLTTRAGFAAFELEDGQLLSGELSLPFSEAAEIAGRFRVQDIALGADSPVSGRLTASVRDIGVGARILPQIDSAGGRLSADLSMNGTLGAPRFDGEATLADGHLAYDPLGLAIDDIQLESRILPGNRVELSGGFRAGQGRARISSSTDYLEGLAGGFEVALVGEDLAVIDLADLKVTISPDMEVGVRGGQVQLAGQVTVPSARLASVKFINTGVSESEDVVFVGGEQPPAESADSDDSPLAWFGNMVLTLGDDVAIDLDVAEAKLKGQATYYWQGPPLPQASGAFDITGKFEAYGQLLEITEGAIRYPHVAASDPLLRIRAERDIFGNSQVRRAGVLVTGTALRPNLEVYTTPATSRDRALTLLATGSDFNYEQGVGAVDVGTYVAPKLYVSYGIGLFDRDNVISIRYDLAQGFGVKATSGKRAAGVDLSYTIEN